MITVDIYLHHATKPKHLGDFQMETLPPEGGWIPLPGQRFGVEQNVWTQVRQVVYPTRGNGLPNRVTLLVYRRDNSELERAFR